VLENADPLSKYEINEKKFLVVMVPKPQPVQPKPAVPTPEAKAPEAAATPAATAEKKEESTSEAKASDEVSGDKKSASSTPAAPGTPTNAPANAADIVVGEDYNRMVQNIQDMGYGREEVCQNVKTNLFLCGGWVMAAVIYTSFAVMQWVTRRYMEFHGVAWSSGILLSAVVTSFVAAIMCLHAIRCHIHEFCCNAMGYKALHGVSWRYMEFHGVT
jgi:hypothetical protein